MYPLTFEFEDTEAFLGVQMIMESKLCKKDNVEEDYDNYVCFVILYSFLAHVHSWIKSFKDLCIFAWYIQTYFNFILGVNKKIFSDSDALERHGIAIVCAWMFWFLKLYVHDFYCT